MLLGSVFSKALRDLTLLTVAIVVIVLLYALVGLGMFSIIGEEYVALLEDMPAAMRAIYGSSALTGTPAGLMVSAIFSLLAPMLLIGFAVVQGARAAVGEEEARTLPLLLANPLSRRFVLLSKGTAVVLGAIAVVIMTWLSVAGSMVLFGMAAEGLDIPSASVQLAGLAFLFGALAMAVAAWTGSGQLGIGVAAIVADVSYLGTTMLPLVAGLEDAARLTPWWLYSGALALTNGVDPALLGVALLVAGGLFLASIVGLERRDLKG